MSTLPEDWLDASYRRSYSSAGCCCTRGYLETVYRQLKEGPDPLHPPERITQRRTGRSAVRQEATCSA